ncbi:MAG: hypothetical protein Q9169_005458 [Polycauliona sp. 2 TL-2023]
MHILTTDQRSNGSTQVLYKRRGGSSGNLGGGSFGAVYLETIDSECKDAPAVRAVKTISKRAAETSKVRWEQEVENLLVLSQVMRRSSATHPYVALLIYGWWEDDQSIFLPMEYFEASDLSRNKDAIRNEDDIRTISAQLALGLHHMHSHGIIHRDIKPQNVFVECQRPTWKVKIGDFGFSKRVSDSVSSPFSARGTMKYMAPEYRDLMNNSKSSDFTTAVDMWSFGCLIYELFSRRCPFDEERSNALTDYVRDGVFPRQPLDDCGASSESIWLIQSLLEREALLRATAEDALQCAWLTAAVAPTTYKSPIRDAIARNDRTSSEDDSSATLRPIITLDSLPASSGATLHHTASAPPELFGVPALPEATHDDPSFQEVLSRPALPNRAITLPESSIVKLPTDDSTLPVSCTVQLPELPVRPKSSNAILSEDPPGIHDLDSMDGRQETDYNLTSAMQSANSVSSIRSTLMSRKPVAKATSGHVTPSSVPSPQTSPAPIFPCLKVSRLSGDYIDMAFKNIKFKPQRSPTCDICESRRVFNPVIKQADLYFCKDCGHRPLCARCIVGSIKTHDDPHEADHKLQLWVQEHTFPLQEFLERFKPLDVEAEGVELTLGKTWLSSDHSFTPPSEGTHGIRWVLNAPVGEFSMSIQIRVSQRKEALESSAIGIQKSMMVNAKAVPLGSILFGARVASPSQCDDGKASRHLPDRPVEQEIKVAKEEQTLTLKLGFNLNATSKQKIEVHIRGSYDVLYFKTGSPFKWWLEQIKITQFGAEQHVASMGDKIMRENAKQLQAKMKRKQRISQGVGLVGQSLGIAGAKGPLKQGQVMLSAVSAGMGLGNTMMRQSNAQRPMAQNSNQPAPDVTVYNNYYFSNSSIDQSQQQEAQGYGYQEVDDGQQVYYEEFDEEEQAMWQQQYQQQQLQ